ncbi:MAG: DUF1549 domain-containing protein [Myxococcales bacterium]|nr:DUF1549 domain-containing protein [Myxococcales bacterium]
MLPMLLWACGTPDPQVKPDPTVPTTTTTSGLLDSDQLLTRISLDLVGERPTIEQLDRVAADPAALEELIDAFLVDPRFERRLEDMYSEVLYIRNGEYYILFDAYKDPKYGGWSEDEIAAHTSEEPLRMLSYLAANDLPYTDYVNGNWTMADEFLADFWPIEYPATGSGWQKSSYTDERPGVGVLSTNAMWWYRGSMENNRNRGRANAVSRIFLCDDYLEREVPFVPGGVGSSEEAVGDAINTNPGCVSCHQTLDPLASHFYGWWFYFHDKGMPENIEVYHAEREFLWKELTGIAPGYFGQPTDGLVDLGRLISEDPRYTRCFVKRAWELTTRTDADLVEVDLSPVQDAFDTSGLRIREVFRAIVHHPAYRGEDERFVLKMSSPELLSSQIEGLTGYLFQSEGRDLLNAYPGYVLLAGGSDGDQVTSPPPTANVTTVLVQQRVAEAAATHVVEHDFAVAPGAGGRTLFTDGVSIDDDDEQVLRDEIAHLQLRMLGRRSAPDSSDTDALLELWHQAHALDDDPQMAWEAVVGVLLRDPDLVMY